MSWHEPHRYPQFALDHLSAPQPVWKGKSVHKKPIDLFVYQEQLWERRPDCLIETGTLSGGSALFFADVAPWLQVITIDNHDGHDRTRLLEHPRCHFHLGDSVDEAVAEMVGAIVEGQVMVSLDSNHSYPHVRRELDLYSPIVTSGQLLVVEDTLNTPDAGRAVNEFLLEHRTEFVEFLPEVMLTYHSWLLRV